MIPCDHGTCRCVHMHEDSSNTESQELLPSVSPELAYNFFQSVVFGAVALSTVRFKFLWTPHMCVLAAAGISHCQVRKELQKRLGMQERAVSLQI